MSFLANLFSGKSKPRFEKQCILGKSGIPLIAARIHPEEERSFLAWRASEVYCGWALDGGLQQLINVLNTRTTTDCKTAYVEPQVYKNKDIMGSIQTFLKDYRIVSTDYESPVAGCIHIKVPAPNDHIVEVYKASPTVTDLGLGLGAKPVQQAPLLINAPAAQAQEIIKQEYANNEIAAAVAASTAGGTRRRKSRKRR